MKKAFVILVVFCVSISSSLKASSILIPMDNEQSNHLKAYGIAYMALTFNMEISWLLNYRGGSFMCGYVKAIEDECKVRGVTYQVIADVQASSILAEIAQADANMDEIKLHKAPKIAVYTPPNKLPWDDAVTLALTYAEIPYEKVYDEEVVQGKLPLYDWLHLHHEDFTGQYGKFWAAYRSAAWYMEEVATSTERAHQLGFKKVSECKLAVSQKIRDFVAGGGYLFAMCSAPDSYDISLAANGVDICDVMFDGDPIDSKAQSKLNFENCFAFKDFKIITNPMEYEVSDIDINPQERQVQVKEEQDFFTLFDFSAKWDPVPTMLCQNHSKAIHGFYGQTTAFRKEVLKSSSLVLGENKPLNEARYIHGEFGKGTWTFYGGHDPEDYQHLVGDPTTDLSLHPNSPGYRLILNNVLFPAAKKKKQKT